MATLAQTFRHTLKYNSSITGETVNRTISGLNFGAGGDSSTGPANVGVGLTYLINTIISFSYGTLSDARFITERQVNL